MRRTSCPSVEISNRSDSGGERQPTEYKKFRKKKPDCISQSGFIELKRLFT